MFEIKSYISFFGVLFAIVDIAVSIDVSVAGISVSIGQEETRHITDYKCVPYANNVQKCYEICSAKYSYSYCNQTTAMCTCTTVIDSDLQTPTEFKCDNGSPTDECKKKCRTDSLFSNPYCNVTTDTCTCTFVSVGAIDLRQATNFKCEGGKPTQTCVDKCNLYDYEYASCDSKTGMCICTLSKPDGENIIEINI